MRKKSPLRPFHADHWRPRFPIGAKRTPSTRAAASARETKELPGRAPHDLIACIRHCVRRQLTLWNQMPWWALEAEDPVEDFGNRPADAYTHRIWWIHVANGRLAIDPSTGLMVAESNAFSHRRVASDEETIRLATYPDQLDASAILLRLQARAIELANRPRNDRTEEWREETRTELGLVPPSEDG